MNSEKKFWLDGPQNIKKIIYALCGLCALLCAADLFDVADFLYHKHTHFDFEKWFGFFCWFGFVSSVVLVVGARLMRKVVRCEEDYYDR
jgi:hypothetical protein